MVSIDLVSNSQKRNNTTTSNKKYLKKDKRRSDPWDFFVKGTSHLLIGGVDYFFSRKERY